MSAQGDCEFLVQRARELVQQDLWAAKAWLITARSLYPADFNIQVSAGRARGRLRGGVCGPRAAGVGRLLPARPFSLCFPASLRTRTPRPPLPRLAPAFSPPGQPRSCRSGLVGGAGWAVQRCGPGCASAPLGKAARPFIHRDGSHLLSAWDF